VPKQLDKSLTYLLFKIFSGYGMLLIVLIVDGDALERRFEFCDLRGSHFVRMKMTEKRELLEERK
jgi:hypothetical protein